MSSFTGSIPSRNSVQPLSTGTSGPSSPTAEAIAPRPFGPRNVVSARRVSPAFIARMLSSRLLPPATVSAKTVQAELRVLIKGLRIAMFAAGLPNVPSLKSAPLVRVLSGQTFDAAGSAP